MSASHINPDQLRWRCRRGMRELDSVLLGFLEREFDQLDDLQKSAFAEVLSLPDPEVYGYLAERSVPEDPAIAHIFERIRTSIRPET